MSAVLDAVGGKMRFFLEIVYNNKLTLLRCLITIVESHSGMGGTGWLPRWLVCRNIYIIKSVIYTD